MDNAFIIDGVIVLILIAGALIGAKRGLIKSLMGVFVVVGALVGSLMLANMLTDPVTDALAPRVEEKVMETVAGELEKLENGSQKGETKSLSELLEKYGVSPQVIDRLLGAVADVVDGAMTIAGEQTMEQMRGALSGGIRATLRATVHTVLVLVGYLVLFVVLTLLAKVLDRVFDLPLLDTTNAVGGAMMGILEAAAVIFVLVFFASRFGVTAITEHADEGRLLPFFMLRKSIGILPALNG